MKRSEINRALRDMEAMLARYRFSLPPFCHFTPEQWAGEGPRVRRDPAQHAGLGHHRLRPGRL